MRIVYETSFMGIEENALFNDAVVIFILFHSGNSNW